MLQQYKGYYFESSSTLTPEFATFSKTAKKELKKELEQHNLELISFSRGHFEVSAFIRNKSTGKMAYFNSLDIRPTFTGMVFFRTVEHPKDYTGGVNNWCDISELIDGLERITK